MPKPSSMLPLRTLFDRVYQPLLFLVEGIMVSLVPADTHSKKRVLIIRLDAIGDYVLWSNAATGLRELYPPDQYTITLLANQDWAALAENSGLFDEVWPLNIYKFALNLPYRWGWLQRIKKTGFSIALHPTYSRRSFDGDSAIRASAAHVRIGFRGDVGTVHPCDRSLSNSWYTRLLDSTPDLMELERNAEFVRAVGQTQFRADLPTLQPTAELPTELRGKNYYVLVPGSRRGRKIWPLTNFAEIAARMSSAKDWIGIITGSGAEREIGEHLIQYSRESTRLQNWAGKTTLHTLVRLIADAKLVIANDTAAIHIATATSTPSVCILGGGHYGRFLPYRTEMPTQRPKPIAVIKQMDCFNCNWHCKFDVAIDAPVPCVANIEVEQVWRAILQQIAQL